VVNGLDGEDIGGMELQDLMNDLQLGEYNALILKKHIDGAKPVPFSASFTPAEAAAWLELNGIPAEVANTFEENGLDGQDLIDLCGDRETFAEVRATLRRVVWLRGYA